MKKIVMIDTEIDPSGLHCSKFTHLVSKSLKRGKGNQFRPSHGTICAEILDQFLEDYELINIEALPNENLGKRKAMGSIRALREALEICLDLKADIVSISAATTLLSDSAVICDLAFKLSQTSILVAALDNHGFVSLPASYPFVIGVQADRAGFLKPGELACRGEDEAGAPFYAGCGQKTQSGFSYRPSNSFAVPVAAAWCGRILERGGDVFGACKCLPRYPFENRPGDTSLWAHPPGTIPRVTLEGPDSVSICRRAMDRLYRAYQVQAAALSWARESGDIRIREGKDGALEEEIRCMETRYKTDILFFLTCGSFSNTIKEKIEPDLEIRTDGEDIRVFYETNCVSVSEEKLAETVYRLLS